jgi:hypothetical protein
MVGGQAAGDGAVALRLARRSGVGDPPPGPVSSRSYEMPVGPVAVRDNPVLAVPYGTGSDRVRTVAAAGSATLIDEARTIPVDRPKIVATPEVVGDLPTSEQPRRDHSASANVCACARPPDE